MTSGEPSRVHLIEGLRRSGSTRGLFLRARDHTARRRGPLTLPKGADGGRR